MLTLEQCRQEKKTDGWAPGAGREDVPRKYLRTINIDTGKVAWEIPFVGTVYPKTWPGVLATTGGLVFASDPNGTFMAVDERDGKPLWHFAANVYMKASPMTFISRRQAIYRAGGRSEYHLLRIAFN